MRKVKKQHEFGIATTKSAASACNSSAVAEICRQVGCRLAITNR